MISLETEEFAMVTPTCGLTVNMVADRLFEVYVYDVKTPPVNKQWSVKVSGDAGEAIDDVLAAYANLNEEQQAEVREAIQATLPEPVGSFRTANDKMQAALPYIIGALALVEMVAQVIMWVRR